MLKIVYVIQVVHKSGLTAPHTVPHAYSVYKCKDNRFSSLAYTPDSSSPLGLNNDDNYAVPVPPLVLACDRTADAPSVCFVLYGCFFLSYTARRGIPPNFVPVVVPL